ncbi:MAG: hypothetical protein ABJE95_09670 [Byssovorax sp.]
MRTSSLIALSFPFVLLLAAPSASAQPVDAATKSAARGVAEEALKLYDKGDYAGAYEKANRANELVHAPTMALLTGRCLEKLGRFVEASEKYLDASRAPLEAGASAAQKSAQTEADKARTALMPRIPSVELALDPPAPDAQVTLDGKAVPPAMVGIKRPIDPGKHSVAVSRGGAMATQDFTLKEADSVRVVLKAPAGKPGTAYYGPPAGGPPQQVVMMYPPGAVAPPPAMHRRNTGLFVTGIILIPIGSLVAIGGTVVLLGNSFDGGSSGGAILGVGLAGLTGGIVMTVIGGKKVPVDPSAALLDPRHSPPAPKTAVTPLFGPVSGVRVTF